MANVRRCRNLLHLAGRVVVLGLLLGSPCPKQTTTTTPTGGTRTTFTFTHQSDPQLGPVQQFVAGVCGLPAVRICDPNPTLGTGIRCPTAPVIDAAAKSCQATVRAQILMQISALIRVEGEVSATITGRSPLGQSASHTHAETSGTVECAPEYLAGLYPFAGSIAFAITSGAAVELRGRRYTDELTISFEQDLCVWADHPRDRTKCITD